MTTYFLSYARADGEIALRFADDLIAGGVSVWVDQHDIRPSQHWDRAVETAVRSCQGMVVILSPRSVASPNVADEVSVAIESGKDVIPVLIEPCTLPLRMTRMQYIDASASYQGALRRCLAVMNAAVHEAPSRAAEALEPTRSDPRLSPEVLKAAERRLIGVMGPISAVLVRNAAAHATSEAELYQALARNIPSMAERDSFLGWVAAAPAAAGAAPAALSAEDLEKLIKALTRQLGPIARQLVLRESRMAGSRQDLCARLAARIGEDRDRAAFYKDVGPG